MDSDIPSVPSPAAFDHGGGGGESGVSTPRGGGAPDDSGWSSLAEVPDSRKAQVLRRHLVSAEERGNSKPSTPVGASPGSVSPTKDGEIGGPSRAGESGVTYGSTSEAQQSAVDSSFAIPYDAPGGDVT